MPKTLHEEIMREATACGRMTPKSLAEQMQDTVTAAYRNQGPSEAERVARLAQRNVGLDWQKLYQRAVTAALSTSN